MKKTNLIILLLAVLIGFLLYSIFSRDEPETLSFEQTEDQPASVEEERKAIVHYPVPQPVPEEGATEAGVEEETSPLSFPEKLPPLSQSDAPIREVFTDLIDEKGNLKLLELNNFIPKTVAIINNLPEKQLAKDHLPLKRLDSRFLVSGSAEAPVTTSRNHKRYEKYVELFEAINPELAVKTYSYFYPLFQEAYKKLGYPKAYFNDRLVFVIDHLLETPEPPEPIQLAQPVVNYTFADPALENRSAGQKLLLRIGPENRRRVKQQLEKYRQLLVKSQP